MTIEESQYNTLSKIIKKGDNKEGPLVIADDSKIDMLLDKINDLSIQVNKLNEKTEKMDKHIDFIDGVYTRIRTPLWWICDRVNLIRGHSLTTNTDSVLENKD